MAPPQMIFVNLPVRDIGMTLSLMVGGGAVAQFDRDSNSYDIIMQVPQEYRDNPERLGDFFVRSATGEMVPLSAVITVSTGVAATAIEQFSQLNSATISALPMPGVTTGDGLATIEEIARPLLPDGFFIDYSGQSRLEIEQGNTIMIAFALAVVVIYLVLAAQFAPTASWSLWLQEHFLVRQGVWYMLVYAFLIIFFAFFYTSITFNPEEVADNMKRYGGFIPGIRAGKPTADYLNYVMTRLTWPGSLYLAVVALIPVVVIASQSMQFGGTTIMIMVGVGLQTVKEIDSQLQQRHYEGFLQ